MVCNEAAHSQYSTFLSFKPFHAEIDCVLMFPPEFDSCPPGKASETAFILYFPFEIQDGTKNTA